MTKIDPREFEERRGKLVSGLFACAKQLQETARVVEDFAQLINGLDGGKRKELVFDTDDEAAGKKRKRTTKIKDPNAPKRPPSSYILFQNEIRNELRKQFPEINNSQLLSLISEKWKSLPEAEKERYNERNRSAKARYSVQKQAYDARSPEEVEAANRALAESVALKKANRGRSKKEVAPAVIVPVPPKAKSEEPESDEEHEVEVAESDEESEEEGTPAAVAKPSSKHTKPVTDSSEEESASEDDDEEEEAPAPKRTKRASSAQPKSKKHKA
ncbi:hypothetical protein FA13DRAFT_1632034 [Coprinellus micaceus]|uniref:HMG box domain-containing protein n=1 Tax=Coprinellus micaceus TaxID=71717 RepID=A0A4Y7T5V0_COPMI|nr:hypothetical protein FA13DRAFT_1632034 [Coprinellus micaceus]